VILAEGIYQVLFLKQLERMYKKILVPVDGSEPSKHALATAMDSASKWDAELEILTVIPPVTSLLYAEPVTIVVEEFKEQLEKIHQKILQEATERVKEKHPELKIATKLRQGHVSTMILQESDKEDIDLIVMGSRGLSGLKCWFLGSVSRSVVEHCKKPILIVK